MLNTNHVNFFLSFISGIKYNFQRIKAPALFLLVFFCMNMGYCAFYKITSNEVGNKIEISKQPKLNTSIGAKSLCSLEDETVNVSMAELSKPCETSNVALGLLLCMIFFWSCALSVFLSNPFKKRPSFSFLTVPLFLQHRRLII